MKPQYDLLGKSHHALAIICDQLALHHPEGCVVQIVRNIPESVNTSRVYPFETVGVEWSVVESESYTPDPQTPKILGAIGKSRNAIFNHFFTKHSIPVEQYHTLIHPSAIVPRTAKIGFGAHIGPATCIAPFAVIGNFCVINRHASVGHHTTMDAFSCLNPGVTLAGCCHLEMHSTVGAGATIIDQIRIGENSVVGAGSVVTKDIPANVVAYGVPAQVVRTIASD